MARAWPGLTFGLLIPILWITPPTRTLHVESSAVVALAAFVVAGLAVLHARRRRHPAGAALAISVSWILLPFVVLLGSTLLRPECRSYEGVLIFAAFVPPSALLGAAIGYAIPVRSSRTLAVSAFVGVGLLVALASLAFDLGFHPQFYTYNHVFGGVLAPLYDTHVELRGGLVAFRVLTLLWCAAIFLGARAARAYGRRVRPASRELAGLAVVAALLIGAYAFRFSLGFNTSERQIARALGDVVRSEHFLTYFDPTAERALPIDVIVKRQEYEFRRLREVMGVEPAEPVRVFVYPTEEDRATLTGARRTSIAPVWLRHPQVHLVEDAHESSFSHELVHVFTREFGIPVVRASWRVGLVEGVAVALEAPDAWLDADQIVRTAARRLKWSGDDLARRVTRSMSARGFWTDRGAVAYAVQGSFVSFLLKTAGADRFRRVYRGGSFVDAYDADLRTLAATWSQALLRDTTALPTAAIDLVAAGFALPSLFESACPHVVPRPVALLAAGDASWRRRDTTAAMSQWRDAAEDSRVTNQANERLTASLLLRGNVEAAVAGAHVDSTSSFSQLLVAADALAAGGRRSAALQAYDRAIGMVEGALIDAAATATLRRALADNPAAVRAFYRPPLHEIVTGEERWGSAHRLAREGFFDEAAAALQSAEVPSNGAEAMLVEWYRWSRIGRTAASAGSWNESERAWRLAAGWAAEAGYGHAVDFAIHRSVEAAWIASSSDHEAGSLVGRRTTGDFE